jgi:hypothetical protein
VDSCRNTGLAARIVHLLRYATHPCTGNMLPRVTRRNSADDIEAGASSVFACGVIDRHSDLRGFLPSRQGNFFSRGKPPRSSTAADVRFGKADFEIRRSPSHDPRSLRAPRQRPRAPGGDRRHRPRCLRFRAAISFTAGWACSSSADQGDRGSGVWWWSARGPNYAPQTVRFHYAIRRRSLRTGINPGSAVVGLCFTSEHLGGGCLPHHGVRK